MPLLLPPPIVADPDRLDDLARQTVDVGRRVEELATAAGQALRDLALAYPRSETAGAAADAGPPCVELLQAEGVALQSLGRALSSAALAYRDSDRVIGRSFVPTAAVQA